MTARRLLIASALLLFAFVLLAHTLVSPDGWRKRARVRTDLLQLREANTTREQHVQQLRAEVAALRTRPEVQERVIRDELCYVREGDLVLEVER
jgi:cell division protein FtsB